MERQTLLYDVAKRCTNKELYRTVCKVAKVPSAPQSKTWQTILWNLRRCAKEGKGLALPQDRNEWRRQPSRYVRWNQSYAEMRRLIPALETAGLITVRLGWKDFQHPDRPGRMTEIYLTSRGRELLRGDVLSFASNLTGETVRLKDESKRLVNYTDNPTTFKTRGLLTRLNRLLSKVDVEWTVRVEGGIQVLPLDSDDFDDLSPEPLCPRVVATKDALEKHRLLNQDRVFRQFNRNSFESGGRFIFSLQQLPKAVRGTLTIDGKPTVELDFSGCLPRILLARQGIDAEDRDIYMVAGRGDLTEWPRLRGLIKTLVNICICCQSRGQAIGAIRKEREHPRKNGEWVHDAAIAAWSRTELPVDPKLEGFCCHSPFPRKALNATEIVTLIERMLPDLGSQFFQDMGPQLMFTESEIAVRIIKAFVDAGKPIIPIHDSFIVLEDDEHLLRQTMRSAFQEETNAGCPVRVVKSSDESSSWTSVRASAQTA